MIRAQRTGAARSPRQWGVRLPWSARPDHGRAAERENHARGEALRLVRDGLCAVCRERDVAATRWLSYFVMESHAQQGTRARVHAAAGLCPAHTRCLLADESAPWLMPQFLDLAVGGGTRLLGEPGTGPARCPCCVAGDDAAERALETLLRAFDHAPVRGAVRDGAVCLPHTAALAARVPAPYALELASAASAALAQEPCETAWLAGGDEDADARAELHLRMDPLLLDEEQGRSRSVTDRWNADVGRGCCPLCLAEHRATWRLLRWAAAATGPGRPAREECALCAPHLYDLAAIGGPNVDAVLAENRSQWDARLSRFGRALSESRKAQTQLGAHLLSAPRCRACDAGDEAAQRQASLLVAQLHDPVQAERYGHEHGICLRHALNWQGRPPAVVREVSTARLALLRWEIDETLREQDWHTRHEIKGSAARVSARAPTLLDGRIYAGLPAPDESRHPSNRER
ncbi:MULTISPECIES: hypothetical protein [unclassified Streptomyces]|uniref:hypothetical protein n=1 Tax=unclassified Streptomyces TaxID=2593676 RepID=UPI000376F68C|nr:MULTISPECIES: hypothetical protein [unclassified Streptomyces]MYQ75820.1 hypothetical protein [Streptomyces sp. SID4923]